MRQSNEHNPNGHLSIQPDGRSRYVGPAFWGSVVAHIPELEDYLRDQDSQTFDLSGIPESLERLKSLDHQASRQSGHGPPDVRELSEELKEFHRMPNLAHMLREVPPRNICRILCESFIQSIHPIIVLLHLPSFYLQYDRFWVSYEAYSHEGLPEGFLAECPTFLPMLFAILFSGSAALPKVEDRSLVGEDEMTILSRRLYKATMRSLSLVGFPRNPTIYSLTAYLIWQNPLIREEDSLTSTSFISTAVRVGQAMGLHRDGSCFGLDPVQTELRRRLWWHIIHMDVMASTSSGLPPLMMDDRYHVCIISE